MSKSRQKTRLSTLESNFEIAFRVKTLCGEGLRSNLGVYRRNGISYCQNLTVRG